MKVAIVGYDIEGQASYRHFARMGADITIFDEAEKLRVTPPEGVSVVMGADAIDRLEQMQPFDVVMRTPGLSPYKLEHIGNVSSSTKEFFSECPASIIGVTGTKGKGTTSSFIAAILEAAGETVYLVGNIGVPALDVLPKIKHQDIVVYEMSSFQLWDMDDSPHVAVVLMIEPDHLEVHDSMADYVSAKGNICRWQKPTDTTVFNPRNKYSRQIAEFTTGAKIAYSEQPGAYVKDGSFFINEQEICSTSTVVLPGKHNLDNACAAITAAWQYVRNTTAIAQGLSSFTGLPHRLKYVDEVDGVKYYDDSIATTPGSAIAAIESFEQPKILIVGGSDKGTAYDSLVEEIVRRQDSIRTVLCIGETGSNIHDLLKQANFKSVEDLGRQVTMNQIVRRSCELASPGDIVILSPASASFGMFRNYADRGDQFVEAVKSLKH